MKKLTNLLLAAMVMSLSVQAQFKKDNDPSPGFIHAMEAILGDFPYNYRHITGELVEATGDWHQYASKVSLPGAESCMIGVYHSELDTTASWQALMFRSEGFRQAATAYKRLYQQLKQCRLKMVDGSVYYLDGDYEEATENNDFVNGNMVSKKKDSEMRPDWMMTGK
jgi:hypothetical protein